MSLNIKDAETHELAAALAKATGESMTRAVNLAIRERLERVKRNRSPCTSLAIGAACAANLESRPIDHAGVIYDKPCEVEASHGPGVYGVQFG